MMAGKNFRLATLLLCGALITAGAEVPLHCGASQSSLLLIMYTRSRFVGALRGHVNLLLMLQQLIYSQQIAGRMTEMIFSSDGERIVV